MKSRQWYWLSNSSKRICQRRWLSNQNNQEGGECNGSGSGRLHGHGHGRKFFLTSCVVVVVAARKITLTSACRLSDDQKIWVYVSYVYTSYLESQKEALAVSIFLNLNSFSRIQIEIGLHEIKIIWRKKSRSNGNESCNDGMVSKRREEEEREEEERENATARMQHNTTQPKDGASWFLAGW